MLPNDNVLMSVGHLDHVLIVYSSMQHVTWRRPNRSIVSLARTAPAHMLEIIIIIIIITDLYSAFRSEDTEAWDRHEDRSEDQGTQERSGLFHSWYTDPTLQDKGEQCNSQVSHYTPCRRREPCHRVGQEVVDREAQRQTRWIKEALWIRKTPMCMNRDAGSYQLSHTWDQVISRSRAPSRCKQSRRDQDVRRTSKRCH